MAIVQATQKMGWRVNPLLVLGILNNGDLDNISSQRVHGVAFRHVLFWRAGRDREGDGVYPLVLPLSTPCTGA